MRTRSIESLAPAMPGRPTAAARQQRRKRTKADPQFATTLARGLEILRCFRPGEDSLGNGEIAARTGFPKPTVSRLTYTLTKLGYLVYLRDSCRYRLGLQLLSLGYTALSHLDIRRVAAPYLRAVAKRFEGAVALGTQDGLDMVYIDLHKAQTTFAIQLGAGSRIAIDRSAMGRAYLAALPLRERQPLLETLRGESGSRWKQTIRNLESGIDSVAERGFCAAYGEWDRAVNAVGAPLVLPDRAAVYAVNFSAPAYQLGEEDLEGKIGPALVEAVSEITGALGHGTVG